MSKNTFIEPKVLVIASTPFSTTKNNGKTLSSFFAGYNNENIAQLSFSYGTTNNNICKRYYFISTQDVKKGNIGCATNKFTQEEANRGYARKKILLSLVHKLSEKRFPFIIWIKNRIWQKNDKYLEPIIEWIKSFGPQVVFFQGFGLSYGYEVTLKICDRLKLPIILELTDDYTTNLYKGSLFSYFNSKRYRKLLKKTISKSSNVIVISEAMNKEYKEKFDGNFITMMNSVEPNCNKNFFDKNSNRDFIYAGNVLLNRWKVLLSFGKVLYENNINSKLKIYSPDTPSKNILKHFSKVSSIEFCGTVSKEDLNKLLLEAYAVVHVEAFDKTNIAVTRLSISTKIPEYMNSGAPIIAIGPKKIASMKYLFSVNAAFCVFDNKKSSIEAGIKKFMSNEKLRYELVQNALRQCQFEHNIYKNSNIVRTILSNAIKIDENGQRFTNV